MAKIKVLIEIDPSVCNQFTIDPFTPIKEPVFPVGAGLTQTAQGGSIFATKTMLQTNTPDGPDVTPDLDL